MCQKGPILGLRLNLQYISMGLYQTQPQWVSNGVTYSISCTKPPIGPFRNISAYPCKSKYYIFTVDLAYALDNILPHFIYQHYFNPIITRGVMPPKDPYMVSYITLDMTHIYIFWDNHGFWYMWVMPSQLIFV